MESYSKWIFRDKESQKKWDEASDAVKQSIATILAESIAETERKLQKEMLDEKRITPLV